MAKWTVSEYGGLPTIGGAAVPIFTAPVVSTKLTAAGDHTCNGGTNFVRVCGDTACHVKHGATGNDAAPYVPAGMEFVAQVAPGSVISIAT